MMDYEKMFCICMGLFFVFFMASRVYADETATGKEQLVASESGFDGAVSIVAEETKDGLTSATVNVPYLDIAGKPKMGQARLFVRSESLGPGKRFPVTCYTHYEGDIPSIKAMCDAGWAVVTPHYGKPEDGEHPIEFCAGNSYNLARAIIQWARRLPLYDRIHLHTIGGSAGGYMSLAMSAEFFPVSSAFVGQPLFNWAFNINYLETNKSLALLKMDQSDKRLFPVFSRVIPLLGQAYPVFGDDLSSEVWYYLSPMSYLDRINSPVGIICATGDILTPHQQMTQKSFHPLDRSFFPSEFSWDFYELTKVKKAEKRFDELIAPENLFVHIQALPENAVEISYEQAMGLAAPTGIASTAPIELPWSHDKQWSLIVLDEGPPMPYSSHQRYNWPISPPWKFAEPYQTATPTSSILNEPKLTRLMERYTGATDKRVTLKNGSSVQRLNYRALEQLDVVTGLLDYADMGAEHEARLKALYKANPLKPFGKFHLLKHLSEEREKLLRAL